MASNDMTWVKIWGLKRTGTNWLRWLLDNNFHGVKAIMDIGGWKHGPPTNEPRWYWPSWYPEWCPATCPVTDADLNSIIRAWAVSEVRQAMIVKHPLALCSSVRRLKRWPQLTRARIVSICSAWTVRTKQFEEMEGQSDALAVIVRYEDLIAPSGVGHALERLGKTLKLRKRKRALRGWIDSPKRYERGNDAMTSEQSVRPPGSTHDRNYWLERRYLAEFGAAELAIARSVLPTDLLRRWRYDIPG